MYILLPQCVLIMLRIDSSDKLNWIVFAQIILYCCSTGYVVVVVIFSALFIHFFSADHSVRKKKKFSVKLQLNQMKDEKEEKSNEIDEKKSLPFMWINWIAAEKIRHNLEFSFVEWTPNRDICVIICLCKNAQQPLFPSLQWKNCTTINNDCCHFCCSVILTHWKRALTVTAAAIRVCCMYYYYFFQISEF